MRAPTPLTRLWVRSLLGFTVGVAVGLAPYLGTVEVPLFAPLLNLVPRSIRDTAIPLSAASMGLIAMFVQWFGADKTTRSWLGRNFARAALSAMGFLAVFAIVHTLVVTNVQFEGATRTESFVVGVSRQPSCACPAGTSDSACIKKLSFDISEIESCWGDRQLRLATLGLTASYILASASIAWMAGLVILRNVRRPRVSD